MFASSTKKTETTPKNNEQYKSRGIEIVEEDYVDDYVKKEDAVSGFYNERKRWIKY